MKANATSIAFLGTLLLSACMPMGSSQPPPLIYALHGPPVPEGQVNRKTANVIAIREPEVPSGFDTEKIALYLHNGRQLDYYANAAWPEPLGKVLHGVLLQSAHQLPGTVAVTANSGLSASREIWIKVNHFEPVYAAGPTEPPQLQVSLSFRVLSANRKIVFEKTYAATAKADGNTRTTVISGLEELLLNINKRAFREIYRKALQ